MVNMRDCPKTQRFPFSYLMASMSPPLLLPPWSRHVSDQRGPIPKLVNRICQAAKRTKRNYGKVERKSLIKENRRWRKIPWPWWGYKRIPVSSNPFGVAVRTITSDQGWTIDPPRVRLNQHQQLTMRLSPHRGCKRILVRKGSAQVVVVPCKMSLSYFRFDLVDLSPSNALHTTLETHQV